MFGLPLTGFGYRISVYERDGVRVPDTPQDMVLLNIRVVTPDYLQAIGLPLRRGRAVDATDGADSAAVALVNEAAARVLWPDADAIGHTLTVGTRLGQEGTRVGGRVVGVVADSRERGPMSPVQPTLYVAHAQFPVGAVAVAIRTAGGGPGVPALRAALADLDPDVPMFRVRTMAQLASSTVAQPRLLMLLMSVFGVAAIGVAAMGLYGVLAQAVEARRKEIGIRRAIGATVGDVVRMIARDTMQLVVAGLGLGIVATAAIVGRADPRRRQRREPRSGDGGRGDRHLHRRGHAGGAGAVPARPRRRSGGDAQGGVSVVAISTTVSCRPPCPSSANGITPTFKNGFSCDPALASRSPAASRLPAPAQSAALAPDASLRSGLAPRLEQQRDHLGAAEVSRAHQRADPRPLGLQHSRRPVGTPARSPPRHRRAPRRASAR